MPPPSTCSKPRTPSIPRRKPTPSTAINPGASTSPAFVTSPKTYTVYAHVTPSPKLDPALATDRPHTRPAVKRLHELARQAIYLTMAQEDVAYPSFDTTSEPSLWTSP